MALAARTLAKARRAADPAAGASAGLDSMTDMHSPGRPEAARHITLTSHPRPGRAKPPKIVWGAADARRPRAGDRHPRRRQPAQRDRRPFRLLRALPGAGGRLGQPRRAAPAGPHQHRAGGRDRAAPAVGRPEEDRLARSLGPRRRRGVRRASSPQGWDIRPTIAVTRARLTVPELKHAVRFEQLQPDGRIVTATGEVNCTKVALEPVWYLPGVAERCGVGETSLRRHLFEQTGGMFPELVTRLRPQGVPAADRRPDRLHLRRPRDARRSGPRARLPGARRVQRLGRVRLRHLHLPALSGARHRGLHRDRPGRRRRADRLQPQGGQGARRGHQVPGLQRPQAAGRRRSRRRLLRAHRVRRRRPGRALPGADAGRAALARHHAASITWSR